jgi:holo-[acyl-carrier protein] synthase
MIVGLGIDLIERDRVRASLTRWGARLVAHLMDPGEADALPHGSAERADAIAFAIAGKEAVSKALGTGWSQGVRWRDVTIVPGPVPRATLFGAALERARRLGSRGHGELFLQVRGNLVLGEFRLLS